MKPFIEKIATISTKGRYTRRYTHYSNYPWELGNQKYSIEIELYKESGGPYPILAFKKNGRTVARFDSSQDIFELVETLLQASDRLK